MEDDEGRIHVRNVVGDEQTQKVLEKITQPQKLKTLPAKEKSGSQIKKKHYIKIIFVFLSHSWGKITSAAFLGEGTDIKWDQRSGAGWAGAQLRVKLKVKGLQKAKYQDKRQKHI